MQYNVIKLLFCLSCLVVSTNYLQAQKNNPVVHFQQETVIFPSNASELKQVSQIAASEKFGQYFYRFVQFEQLPTAAQHQQIKQAGIQLLEYIPNNVYIAAIPITFDFATWSKFGIVSIQPIGESHKTSKRLQGDLPSWAMEGNYVNVSVQYYSTIKASEVQASLLPLGALVQESFEHVQTLNLQVLPAQLAAIKQLACIKFLDLMSEPGQPESDDGRNLHRSNAIDNDYFGGRNYDGTGINIAINDDGFVGPHIDFTGRLNQQDVANDFTGTHGDMTTGIAGGAGNLDPTMRGMAPGSYIHVRQYTSAMGGTIALHQDSAVLVFNSSYSNGCGAGYTTTTRLVDGEIVDNPTLMQVFSAGNSNGQDCGYGAGTQWGNITGGHKEGKNVIATANLSETDAIIASSSRGPAVDGRIKPDISAHGNSQMSTDPDNTYAAGGGTSAAAPGIAGVMAQLYDAYGQLNSGNTAPSALLKATMLNTANDLGNDGPDFIYGWGKVNGLKAAQLLEENRYLSGTITQGDSATHSITIPAGVQRAKIMVYWVDPEGATTAAYALVNDLDATVQDAANTTYLPWVLDIAPNVTSLATPATKGIDTLNNVEQIAIDNPTAGTYNLKIKGKTIPFGTQEYWVVYEFLYDDITVTFPMGGEGLLPGVNDRIHWDAYGDIGNFTIEFSRDGGATWIFISTAPGTARFFDWTVPAIVNGQSRIRVSRGAATDESDANFSIINRPGNIRVDRVCASNNTIELAWNNVPGATGYDVFMLGDKYMDSIGSSTGLQHTITVPDVNASYWFSVRSTGPNGIVGLRQIAVQYSGTVGGQATCFLSCNGGNDAGIDSILSPSVFTERCGGISAVPVQVQLQNIGLFTETNFEVYYQVDNNPIVRDTFTGNLNAGSTALHTFNQSLNVSAGQYTIKIWTGLETDSTSCNDTLYQTFEIAEPLASFPYQETFEGNFFPLQNSVIINSDNATTWTTINVAGIDGNTTNALYLNNYNYNAVGEEDIFQVMTLDLSAGVTAALKFDVAYRQYNTAVDELRVDISTDCGQTYSPIYLKGGATLATSTPITSNWAPTAANEWRTDSIDLTSYIGNNITLRFVNICAFGQNLYLDNINVNVTGVAPNANFAADVTTTCLGEVNFEDKSGNDATSWLWTFGDGTTSTAQNPTHTYANSGLYTVTLQATNAIGNDLETKTNYIRINYPEITSVINGFGCENDRIGLDAVSQTSSLEWLDNAGNLLTTSSFGYQTPPLTTTTTYQVREVIASPSQKVGPVDGTIGGGGYHNSTFVGAINFTADTSFTLVSVWVDANGAGDRVVYLWDGNVAGGGTVANTVLQQVTVTLVDGPQRVNLNMQVPGSGDYALGGSSVNLYRNNSSVSYPYSLPNVVTMTGSTAGAPADFYYYFYDWELQLSPCVSPAVPVTATVLEPNFSYVANNSTVAFTDNTIGATSWIWDFGDGNTSNVQNPTHTYATTGNYTVTLRPNSVTCTHADTVSVTVGIQKISNDLDVVLSPNPTNNQATLRFSEGLATDLEIQILSIDGKVLQQTKMPQGATQQILDLNAYPSGVYLVKMYTNEVVEMRKLVKE